MRKVWLLASAVLAFLNFVKSQEVARTLYSARYDNLDIDTILGSNRLVSNYVDCLLSRKPCPPEGKDLKRILPEALRTKCARCSPIQKENALKIITRLYYDYPDQYRALRERWDPSGEYHRRFEEYLRGLQFNQIGGNGGTTGGSAASGGNTVEGGGNDRPVRNDLDRQPATQSSNVQTIVVAPTLAGQPSGNVNAPLFPIVPSSTTPPLPPPLPPLPPSSAVPAATERPRPPAPVAQILFPTTTDTTNTTNTIPASTTLSTTTSDSGQLELTSTALGGAPVPSNIDTFTSSSSSISSMVSSPDSTVEAAGAATTLPDDGNTELNTTATAGPVVPVPVNYYLNITNGGSLTLWMVHRPTTTTTPRPTTTVRQTRPATRQTTTRNTQRTTTRFITRVPQTPPPTPPRTVYTTRTSTILPQRPPPPPPPAPVPSRPSPAIQQQPIPLPQAPPQAQYPTILYERPAPQPQAPPTTYYVPAEPPRAQPQPPPQQPPQYGPATPDSIIDHFFVPPSQAANPQPLPIVGLWNQLGTKIADTADAIAGMLKKTVDVLVTSHIQSHQRALRRS
uniref:Uncharacterized protein n=1 Tax=Anopheles farauti TaxID=69004 RepID=A0A182QP41_9DIPT